MTTFRKASGRGVVLEPRPVDPVDGATGLRWWKGWSDDSALGAMFGAAALEALGTILSAPPPAGGGPAREVRLVAADDAGRCLVQVGYAPGPDDMALSRECRAVR